MSISTTALDRRSAVKIAAAASLLAAGGAGIFMVDAVGPRAAGKRVPTLAAWAFS